MRKAAGIFILLTSCLVLFAAMDRSFINGLKQDRYFDHLNTGSTAEQGWYHRLFIRSDRWAYGDLYGQSFLHPYKDKLAPFNSYPHNKHKPITNRVLYIIGDSFLADKTLTSAFKSFDNVQYLDRRFAFGPITLDSNKQNYLLLEFAERNLVGYALDSTQEARWTAADIKARYNLGVKNPQVANNSFKPDPIWARINKVVFNKDLSRNLELLLFDDKLFTPLKELKASLNYSLFKRLPKEVAVSTDKKRLLMNITVDTASTQSAFRAKTDVDIIKLADNIAEAKAYYRSLGFQEIYLSVIPNPASVYDSRRGPYNRLLQRVEQRVSPLISVYDVYRSSPANMYYLSDSHWNPLGFDTWVKKADSVFNASVH